MFDFSPAPRYVYKLLIDGKMVGYTNKFDHKIMVDLDDNRVHYFGVYATAKDADKGDTRKHSHQYWLKDRSVYKLEKEKVV